MTYDFLQSEQAFAEFLDAFEQGTLPKHLWTHGAHLAVGTWYLVTFTEDIAIERVRTGIRHYNECVGTRNTMDSGYHETLTLFWLGIISGFLLCTGSGRRQKAGGRRQAKAPGVPAAVGDRLSAVQSVVEKFGGQRDLFKKYYSFDVVASREARVRWVAPDRIVSEAGNKSTLRDI